ncbi:MAG: Dam family site-specific DNA-(adenine-N6)-methyltransferase [Candidatus Gastranaerophilales bacterium]|nr:Dam family site-specific DNA-(adenine-N6)-methyltransferase [Candidatus Gastranaerophilales bacterium]
MTLNRSYQSTLDNFENNSSAYNFRNPQKITNNIPNRSFLKCPFNYIGGKYKILPQLYSVFPRNPDIFVDLFGGGFNVGLNSDANKIYYNDQLTPLVDLFKYLQDNKIEDIISYIENTIIEYNLSKEDKESYNIFRDKYNKSTSKCPLDLYILVAYSFNYQFRFNNQCEYNNPHGTNRSQFTSNMKDRLIKCIDVLHKKNITFSNKDFLSFNFNDLTENSLVYCDPPYLITTGSYNDGNRGFKNWTKKEETELLNLLSKLNKENIKFALSNVTNHDGKQNDLLIDWINRNDFKVLTISTDYTNSNYQKKNKNNEANKEVLIINY